MGLEISYGKIIKKVDNPDEFNGGIITAYVPEFAIESLEGLELGASYQVEWVDGFNFGSYTSFGLFRELLGKMIGVDNISLKNQEIHKNMPFYEFLYFPDNEGVFGPKAARAIKNDFDEIKSKVSEFTDKNITDEDDREWFIESYDWLHKAFIEAADDGFVLFG